MLPPPVAGPAAPRVSVRLSARGEAGGVLPPPLHRERWQQLGGSSFVFFSHPASPERGSCLPVRDVLLLLGRELAARQDRRSGAIVVHADPISSSVARPRSVTVKVSVTRISSPSSQSSCSSRAAKPRARRNPSWSRSVPVGSEPIR